MLTELLAAAVAGYGGISALLAGRLLFPGIHQTRVPPPPWLTAEQLTIDRMRIRLHVSLPDGSSPVCVLQHGLGECSAGLTTEAALLRRLGLGVVMMDLPGHGESDIAATTYGPREARILGAALDALEVAGRVTILWGRSTGAAAVLKAAATLPNVKALILDCMFDNPLQAIVRHAVQRPLYRPLIPLIPGVIGPLYLFLRTQGAHRFPIETIGGVDLPLLLVTGSGDLGMPPVAQQRLLARARHKDSRVLVVPGARHYECFRREPQVFEEWLVRYGRRAGAMAAAPRC